MGDLNIQIKIKDNKIYSLIHSKHYKPDDIQHQLEILGILENLKLIQHEKIKTLLKKKIKK